MKALLHAAAGLLAIVFLIQPCPAPLVVFLPLIIFAPGFGEVGPIGLKRDAGLATAGDAAMLRSFDPRTHSGSAICLQDLKTTRPLVRLESATDAELTVHNIPPSCKRFVAEWNSQPNITALNGAHGKMRWQDDTNAVHVWDIPAHLQPRVQQVVSRARSYDQASRLLRVWGR